MIKKKINEYTIKENALHFINGGAIGKGGRASSGEMDSLKRAFACAKAGKLKVKTFWPSESPRRFAYLVSQLLPADYPPALLSLCKVARRIRSKGSDRTDRNVCRCHGTSLAVEAAADYMPETPPSRLKPCRQLPTAQSSHRYDDRNDKGNIADIRLDEGDRVLGDNVHTADPGSMAGGHNGQQG